MLAEVGHDGKVLAGGQSRSFARTSQKDGCSITSIPSRSPSTAATASPSALFDITMPT